MPRPHTVGGRDAYACTLAGRRPVFSPQTDGHELTEFLPRVEKFNDFAARSKGRVCKIYLGGDNRFADGGLIHLTHPESSPVFLDLLSQSAGGRAADESAYFRDRSDPRYRELLAILKEAKTGLSNLPRIDIDGGKAIPQERNFGRVF